MVLTDTHAHLYVQEFENDIDQVISNALEVGVSRVFLPNIDVRSMDAVNDLAARYPKMFFPMMGMHPCSVKENFRDDLAKIRAALFSGKYFAVGEMGIDLFWDKSTLPIQIKVFEEQIAWAKELQLPIVIHARDSFNEIFEVMDRLCDNRLTGVFHCFTGSLEQAQKIMSYRGFYMGIGGVLTYPKAQLDLVLKDVPLEYMVLETDSPYLPPVPFRGKRNQSAYIRIVAERLASVKQISLEELARITTENSKKLFGV
ncbi:MAG: TatD family hydrolase [Flavobacteriales bacterium]|nr:TatD family hydrolase [Flavobacteriales bacterium]